MSMGNDVNNRPDFIEESIRLEDILCDKKRQGQLVGRHVLIWSGEHSAWWRTYCSGYTPDSGKAGVYKFEDAFKYTAHYMPHKKIRFDVVAVGEIEE